MRNAKLVVFEALLVAGAGLILALAANALSPSGLRLARNYFPDGGKPAVITPVTNSTAGVLVKASTPTPPPITTVQRLQQKGLQLVSSNEVAQLFQDPRYEQGLVLFIDARDEQHYAAGHIPGAWQFNHYRPENFLPTLMPLCLTAQKVVVYCTGGECEDSEFAAILLRDTGVPSQALFVYTGGITEWKNASRPVEMGQRRSGQLSTTKP